MKKIVKKNQVIITSLAILIAVAGYLNFADVDLGFKDQGGKYRQQQYSGSDVDYDLSDETALLDENGADGSLGDSTGRQQYSGRSRTYSPHLILLHRQNFPENRSVPRIRQTCRISSITQKIGDDQKQEASEHHGIHD